MFSLVMVKENISFAEAMRWLAKRAGLSTPALSAEDLRHFEEERSIEDALSLATQFFHQELGRDGDLARRCRSYLDKRGASVESIEELKLGAASGTGLLGFLRSQGVADEVSLKAGLVEERDGRLVDFFRDRSSSPA